MTPYSIASLQPGCETARSAAPQSPVQHVIDALSEGFLIPHPARAHSVLHGGNFTCQRAMQAQTIKGSPTLAHFRRTPFAVPRGTLELISCKIRPAEARIRARQGRQNFIETSRRAGREQRLDRNRLQTLDEKGPHHLDCRRLARL